MADVVENGPLTDAAAAIALGKRYLLVRDFNSAVTTLIKACELMVQKYGDDADELAEPYLLYGRALLNLAREESNILGTAVPCDKDSDDEVDGEDEEVGDDDDEKGEDEKSEKNEKDEKCGEDKKEEKSDVVKHGEAAAISSSEKKEDANTEVSKAENKSDEKKPTESKEEDKTEENHVTDDAKAENKGGRSKGKESEILKDEAIPGSSKMTNGESSFGHLNGDVKENGEDVEEDNDDEDVDNLEVAWEVLELAKITLLKRGQPGWQLLAEAHKLLGEVAMEGGNAIGALTDFKACLDLLQKIEPCNPRAIAEIYYQLGLAYSFASDFDSSIQEFKEASSVLKARIKELEETSDPPKSEDPFYSVEGEIKELKDLLPEIEEKISDTKDARNEACKLIMAGIRDKVLADNLRAYGASTSASNGASSSGAPSGSSSEASFSKPVSDISHLVRKKRKPEESQVEDASPCKKLSPQ